MHPDPAKLGRTLRKLVAEKIPAKPGAKLALYHLTQPLILHQNLEQQGIAGESVTISCTYSPTNLQAAWVYLQGIRVFEEEFALEGGGSYSRCSDSCVLASSSPKLEGLDLC